MEITGKSNIEEIRIQGLLDVFLNRNSTASGLSNQSQNHLDEDSLSAFVEGSLGNRESKTVVSHLVDCSFCRHVTAELVRLDLVFAGEPVHAVVAENQPSKISEVLNGLLSRIFGTSDGSVFAHQEDEKPDEPASKDELNEK